MGKQYIITVKIDDDTIGRAKFSKVVKSANQVSEFIHEALAMSGIPYRGAIETFVNQSTLGFSFQFVFVEGGNLIKVLSGIKENLRLRLKMKPEEIGLALTSIVDKETNNPIF
jgi:hypothetical protein